MARFKSKEILLIGLKGEKGDGGIGTVDTELSTESENAVQNKAITKEFNNKVGFEDYATTDKAGVFKQGTGFYMSNGILQLNSTSASLKQADLTSRMSGSSTHVCLLQSAPIITKLALIQPNVNVSENRKAKWTEEEKALARETLGATKVYYHATEIYNAGGELVITVYYYSTSMTNKVKKVQDGDVYMDMSNIVGEPYAIYVWDEHNNIAKPLIVDDGHDGFEYEIDTQLSFNVTLESGNIHDTYVGV